MDDFGWARASFFALKIRYIFCLEKKVQTFLEKTTMEKYKHLTTKILNIILVLKYNAMVKYAGVLFLRESTRQEYKKKLTSTVREETDVSRHNGIPIKSPP